jgi:catechol 2,3-dioxygenase-like lactoylglutathione lyase family enzyme
MAERDGYIPGVPCWIDTTRPDPEAAVDFYGGLFGWEFEDVMPPGAPGSYFMGRLRGGDVAAVGSQPEGAPPMAVWNKDFGSHADFALGPDRTSLQWVAQLHTRGRQASTWSVPWVWLRAEVPEAS